MRESCQPRAGLTNSLSRWFLPLVITLNAVAFVIAQQLGISLEITVTLGSVLSLAAAWLLQRWIPLRDEWNAAHADTATDLTSMVVLLGLIDPLLKALGVAAALALAAQFSPLAQVFPDDLPFAAQVLLALLLLELGKYAAHRLHHAHPALWWLHAMHHSPERFTAVNNFRFHPLNYAINFSLSVLPMLLIGIPADVMWAYLALTQPVLMMQHANLNLRNPWLDNIFATPRSHLWHHDADERAGQLNFGSALLIWDHVFGTYRASKQQQPHRIGLYAGSSYPAQSSYFAQLLSMFKPGCCAQGGRA
jgi:ornithine lipid hydroxylase